MKSQGKIALPQLIENQLLRPALPAAAGRRAAIRRRPAAPLPGPAGAPPTPRGGLPREVCLPLSVRPYGISEGERVWA